MIVIMMMTMLRPWGATAAKVAWAWYLSSQPLDSVAGYSEKEYPLALYSFVVRYS